MPRHPSIHHCTSQPLHFFGRVRELAMLDEAIAGGDASVVAMIGPGGQGKTAIAQHWLHGTRAAPIDGIFLWSFYRNKDSDLFLRHLLAYAEGLESPPEVAASYCVDRLVEVFRRERWALVLDGVEVVQHESGSWFGRFVHPELARFLEELAAGPMPGVAVVTSRFPLPTLACRRYARIVSLAALDRSSGRELLRSLGVPGTDSELEHAAASVGLHAKAVELLGTLTVRAARSPKHERGSDLAHASGFSESNADASASEEEIHVARVLDAFRQALPQEDQDILALATAFRQPPSEARLLEYLRSEPVANVLAKAWGRGYVPFSERDAGWLEGRIQELVDLRLLERVGIHQDSQHVIDAHPLVRRGFEHVLGKDSGATNARTRAGFLRGRPDRRPAASLDEAREEVELFHAYCDAGLWNEADGVLVALDNPKHRFLAPVFERDLLLRFFPEQDWRRPPAWPGFGRQRSLAICFEMLGQFEEALAAYRDVDAALRGDTLIALGRLTPLLNQPNAPQPWQALWQAYRAHALCLAGRVAEAVALARSLVPVDVYEWVHVFECLLRARQLDVIDVASMCYRPPFSGENRWSVLARRRMRADYLRLTMPDAEVDLDGEYRELLDAYDRGGLPYERALSRLSYACWLEAGNRPAEACAVRAAAADIGRRFHMPVIVADATPPEPRAATASILAGPRRP